MLVSSIRTKASQVQRSSFHTSSVVQRYGRQNRGRGNAKNFFRPGWRYFLNLENMQKNAVEENSQGFGQYLYRTLMFNWPIGDYYIKDRKPLLDRSWDEWKLHYDKLFPDDSMKYLQKSDPEDNKWYLTPKERFFNRMRTHLDTGMSKPAAFATALQEKRWEEEARDMEFEVQKQQAEVLFGIPEINWHDEVHARPEPFSDDRQVEVAKRDWEDRLMYFLTLRKANPERRKIKQSDLKIPMQLLRNYLIEHPEDSEHFEESAVWGDLAYHTLPESLPKELWPRNVEAKEGDNTLLEDVDARLGDWAKDLLSIYWDKVDIDNADLTPEEKEDLVAKGAVAESKRQEILEGMAPNLPEIFGLSLESITQSYYKDGAHEVLSKSREGRPQINPNLEKELSDLFNTVGENK